MTGWTLRASSHFEKRNKVLIRTGECPRCRSHGLVSQAIDLGGCEGELLLHFLSNVLKQGFPISLLEAIRGDRGVHGLSVSLKDISGAAHEVAIRHSQESGDLLELLTQFRTKTETCDFFHLNCSVARRGGKGGAQSGELL